MKAKLIFETKTPRIVALLALVFLTLLALSGCTRGDRSTAGIDPTGVYTLISVDGKSPPCELTHGGNAMTIKTGVFTINADGTCQSLMKFSVAGHDEASREVKATYTLKGAHLTMKWEGAGTTLGQVDGNRFTMTNEGMVLSYQK